MNGTIAQAVAITCYGNAKIRELAADAFFPNNSTCQFCDAIRFAQPRSSHGDATETVLTAETPDLWFMRLIEKNALGLRLRRQPVNRPGFPDRMSAGFIGGGGQWFIEVLYQTGMSEFWIAKWEVWDQNAPERKIWRVTYLLAGSAETRSHPLPDVDSITADLKNAVIEIHQFSEEHECEPFTRSFANALKALDDRQTDMGYYHDIAPPGALPKPAMSLLKAATSSYVFGGMGSWNDMGFEGADQEEYDRVSENLFGTTNLAIEVAAASSMPVLTPSTRSSD